ncbi:winged helix-turn-helix transcriptional regulator [bacterium]|nr:winged helix-turn-helix transcriptional regulator [bacterium]
MNKSELIRKLEDIEWEDFDYYKITFPITTTQKTIALIGKSPEISRKELAEVIGLTEDGIKYHLKKMQKKGIIKRIGPAKGGHWEVGEK